MHCAACSFVRSLSGWMVGMDWNGSLVPEGRALFGIHL